MNALRWMLLVAVLPALAAGGEAARAAVIVHLDRPARSASALLEGGAVPAPGTPGAEGLLPQLLRNASFEQTPPAKPLPLPRKWGKVEGWDYRSCGSKRMLVRTRRGQGSDVLVLASGRDWAEYHLKLIARKIDGPGGFCILFEVSGRRTHLRWTLGALGNRYHVLEKVRDGHAERLGPAVVGRIEAGRCYRIDVRRFKQKKETEFSLDGRLVFSVRERMPDGGIGLADGDATAEYFDMSVHGRKKTPLFLLDHPSEGRRSTLSAGWEPLADPRNAVAYKWDLLYPANSHLSQQIEVRKFVGGDAGIRQRGVPVTAGRAYRGRIHLRRFGRPRAVVSLRSAGGKVYAQQALGEPTDVWKPFDFALTPSATDPKADFCITAAPDGIVWVDQVSLVAEGSAGAGGVRREVVDRLRKQRPGILRWPAGPGLRQCDWRDGVGPMDERPVTAVTGGEGSVFEAASNRLGTAEFLALCQAAGAEPMLTVNPFRGMRPALYWLEYCNGAATTRLGKQRAEHGRAEPWGVTLWAIGGLPLGETKPEVCAEEAAKTIAAMREQDPSVRVLPLLWDGHPLADRVTVEAPAAVLAAAACDGARAIARLVHLGGQPTEVAVAIRGLGNRKLAAEGTLLSIDGDATLTRRTIPAAHATMRLLLPPHTVHVLILPLEGTQP